MTKNNNFEQIIMPFVGVCDLVSDSVDMIQAGGGNASAKYVEEATPMMLVKASGFLMSEVDAQKGYAKISLEKILKILEDVSTNGELAEDETQINKRVAEANQSAVRPSIETFLHALMPQRFVLHVHALTTLIYTSSKRFCVDLINQWEQGGIFPNTLLIPYEKPGIHLAMAMKNGMDRYLALHGKTPNYLLLQNHGLIVADDDSEQLYTHLVHIENQIKTYMGLSADFDKRYRDQFNIKRALRSIYPNKRLFVRVNEDRDLVGFIDGRPSFPDALVFCGLEPLNLESHTLDFQPLLSAYAHKYQDFPKVIFFENQLFFVGESIKKCLEVQDVLKVQWILRKELKEDLVTLTDSEAYALLNWEAEKYRKQL